MEKKSPERHEALHDPKLPVIHGAVQGNRAQNRICPSPVPNADAAIFPGRPE